MNVYRILSPRIIRGELPPIFVFGTRKLSLIESSISPVISDICDLGVYGMTLNQISISMFENRPETGLMALC
jgi:hypothetical protein